MTPIYWINLDARRDRRAFMEAQFAAFGLVATRVSALAPTDLAATGVAARAERTQLSLSERCVTESHRKVWKTMRAYGQGAALVLEDDAVLSPALGALLSELEHALDGPSVIRLETGVRRVRAGPPLVRLSRGITLRRAYSAQWGTAGYVITAAAADRLSDHPTLFSAPLDRFMFDPHFHTGADLSWLQCAPGLLIQGDQRGADEATALWRSDVLQDRRAVRAATKTPKTGLQRVTRETMRLLRQGRDLIVEGVEAVQGVRWRSVEFFERG